MAVLCFRGMSAACALSRIDAQLTDVEHLLELGEVNILTPRALEKLRNGIIPTKPLCCELPLHNITLRWPIEYPDADILEVIIDDTALDLSVKVSLDSQIKIFTNAYVGSSCGYALDIVHYYVELKDSLQPNISTEKTRILNNVTVLQFNHLLRGNEHKKEKDMLTAGKRNGLLGGMVYGTPGYVVIISLANSEGDMEVNDYVRECRSIGKRGEVIYQGAKVINDDKRKGFSEWSLGDIEEQLGGADIFRSIRMPN